MIQLLGSTHKNDISGIFPHVPSNQLASETFSKEGVAFQLKLEFTHESKLEFSLHEDCSELSSVLLSSELPVFLACENARVTCSELYANTFKQILNHSS